jgi:hypothetical protein
MTMADPQSDPVVDLETFRQSVAELKREFPGRGLRNFGPGGTSGGMEPWQPALNRLEDKVDTHLKWLLIAFASGFVLLGGLIINRTDAVLDRFDTKFDAMGSRIDSVGDRMSSLSERVAKVEAKLPEPIPPAKP